MLVLARHAAFRQCLWGRHASIKALRARSRRVFEDQTKKTTLTGEGGFKFKEVQPLDLGNANPYSVIGELLRSAHEAEKGATTSSARNSEQISLHPDVINVINALVDHFEPAVDTVDDLAVTAVMKTFSCFQPTQETTTQLLLRELALDGGRLPSKLLNKPQPMALRMKYALDGCKSFTEATERLRNIATRLDRCQLLPTTDPGAALLGDYAFVPGPPPTVRPPPAAIAASIKAGDMLPALLWPEAAAAPPSLEQLWLPPERAQKLGSVQLTQPVGRTADLGVTHMATLRWAPDGRPSLTLHANALWRGVELQPRRGGWPSGTVPSRTAGPSSHATEGYPFPPYLSHQAIQDAGSGSAAAAAAHIPTAAAAGAADAAGAAGDAHTVWRHDLMYDPRGSGGPRPGRGAGRGSGRGPRPAATWTCRLLRSTYRHTSDVEQAATFLKPLAFAQSANCYVKDTPAGPLSMLVTRPMSAEQARGWAPRAVMERASARWRGYRDALAAAVAAGAGARRDGENDPPRQPERYQPPGPVVGLGTMFTRTWVGSAKWSVDGVDRAATALPLLGWASGYKWPQPHHWLALEDGQAAAEPPAEAAAGGKLVDSATLGHYCDGASLAWRLDRRVPPLVRAHPFTESNTILGDPATRIWELFAWSASCDPPRMSGAGGDGPAQHAQQLRDSAPHHGVFPIVTPPDWRCAYGKKRWLLDLPIKALWTAADTRQAHAGLALFLVNTMDKLAKEGWQLDGALHGVLHLSRPQGDRLEMRRTRAVTAALAFGVLREIRTVPRRPPGERFGKAFGRARVGVTDRPSGTPFRQDAYMPYTAVDLRVLDELGLPSPAELDDSGELRAHAARAVHLLVERCAEKMLAQEKRIEARCRRLDFQEITP